MRESTQKLYLAIMDGDLEKVVQNVKTNGRFSKSNVFDVIYGKTIFTHACERYKMTVEKGVTEYQAHGEKFAFKKNDQKSAYAEQIYFEIVKHLISKADIKDINIPYLKEGTPLIDVVQTGNQLLVIDIISDKKADVNKLDNLKRSPLSLASDEKVEKILIMHGAINDTAVPSSTTTTTTTTMSFGNSN